jgi:selenide, water dikinase
VARPAPWRWTGGRCNWAGYGQQVRLPQGFGAADQALLSDPQTSGGLLVACRPDTVDAVLDTFRQHGFEQAAVVGAVQSGPAELVVQA